MTTVTLKTQHQLTIKHKGKYQLIAQLNGKDVGYLMFKFEVAEVKNRVILLDWMEVSPKFQGLGIGKALVKAFLKEIKDKYPTVVMINLWTSKELEEAGHGDFYKQFGFKKLAVRRDYYAPGIHCALYAKRVASGKLDTIKERAKTLRKARLRAAKKLKEKTRPGKRRVVVKRLHPRKKKV